MVNEVVQAIMKKFIDTDMSHLRYPAVVRASVTSASKTGEEYECEFKSRKKSGGADEEVIVTGEWYSYNLKILDKDGSPSADYPEIPSVKSQFQIKSGRTVAVALPYGELLPFIIGEVGS